MKHINVPFEDSEVEAIEEKKGNKSWRTFILDCAGVKEGGKKNEDKKNTLAKS